MVACFFRLIKLLLSVQKGCKWDRTRVTKKQKKEMSDENKEGVQGCREGRGGRNTQTSERWGSPCQALGAGLNTTQTQGKSEASVKGLRLKVEKGRSGEQPKLRS